MVRLPVLAKRRLELANQWVKLYNDTINGVLEESERSAKSVYKTTQGIAGGTIHGETDELDFHAIEPAHYVTDMHATVLALLGLDPARLDIPGRKRLDIDRGATIREIIA